MEFYDANSGDLRELWESYLTESALGQDVLMATREEEWGNVLCLRDKTTLGVVLRDRLMTDAALGGPRPIKSEHSYSLLTSSPPPSPATPGANPPTPNSTSGGTCTGSAEPIEDRISQHRTLDLRSRIDDMEEECFPAISLNTASGRGAASPSPCPASSSGGLTLTQRDSLSYEDTCREIKGEPESQPGSPRVPSPSCTLVDDKTTITMVAPNSLHFTRNHLSHPSESEEDDDEYYPGMELENAVSPGNDVTGRGLPPTPPSSASSDSEGTVSASCSPERRDSQGHVQNLRGLLTPRLWVTNGTHTHATRQPIHTPLISCQPKGSTGVLTLTEEEKRTLIAEGYPVPTKLPLTKQEEKSLKKVRRKIKNKISAQESRRKKKEYMDGLERRVTLLANENSSYRDRLTALEGTNRELLKELQRLQALLQG
ncbi:cyclic AMP response element-binding protein A [Orussus abietinus]|uniref:cyclic AMP response element-binding protein A n=1 Tax=Orussus abietinus TaxID=222816 RepID=UPI000626C103|nr:cyclic AMP response element-binding protein A [Orussus abietinus]XP_012279782.1 cyclic AMP response element-binding protein A [Orussus abietinus]